MRYEAPKFERLGTFREFTQSAAFVAIPAPSLPYIWKAGGCLAFADGANPYHRYDGKGDLTCPLT